MKKKVLLILLLTTMAFAQTDSETESQLAHETVNRCIAENFDIVYSIEPSYVYDKSGWVHYMFCKRVALGLAKKYLTEHPKFAK